MRSLIHAMRLYIRLTHSTADSGHVAVMMPPTLLRNCTSVAYHRFFRLTVPPQQGALSLPCDLSKEDGFVVVSCNNGNQGSKGEKRAVSHQA